MTPRDPRPIVAVQLDRAALRRLVRMTALVCLVVLILYILQSSGGALSAVVISLLLASLFAPVVSLLENHGVHRATAIIGLYVVLVLLTAVVLRSLVPIITHEVRAMAEAIQGQGPSTLIATFKNNLAENVPILKIPSVDARLSAQLEKSLKALMESAFGSVLNLIASFPKIFIVGFMTFFLLKDGRRMKKALIQAMPNRYFEMSLLLTHKIVEQVGRYVRGQLIVAAAVGALSITALYFLHIRYYLLLGTLAGLANMIPYFGSIFGAVPPIIIGFLDTGSFGVVLGIAAAFATIQLLENVLISPLVVAKSVELHPLAIIIVVLVGGGALGLWGMLLSVPLASITKVTVSQLLWGFRHYRLG